MAQSATELIKLSKDSLINMAIKKISEPTFDVADFDQIEVWMDGEDLTVDFQHAIEFIPQKGQFYYGLSLNLISGSPAMYIKGKGPWEEDVTFYKPSRYKDDIKFIIDAINNSDGEIGKIPEGQMPDGTMTIQEQAGYYDIKVDSESTHSYYKIKKGSGKVYDAGHKHYADFGEPSTRKRIY
jgi:hypothetical protein